MAKQIGIGTLLGSDFVTTGYADEDGRALIRMKSRLDKLKWKRSPKMKWSREAARQFGAASTIAGGIWKNVPGGLRRLMDAGAFNRLVGICRVMQEWDGNLSDFDGFRNLDLSQESYGPHRVVRDGDGWAVSGLAELMGELDKVTVVCLNQNSQNSPNSQDLEQNFQNSPNSQDLEQNSQNSPNSQDLGGGLGVCAGPEALEGGALGQCDAKLAAGGEIRRGFKSGYESECVWKKRRKKIRRMAGVVSEKDFRHDTGRFWERVEDVYRGQENPKVRFWEGRGMFDYGRVTPPRIVFGQRFLRSPYVSCWPYEGNLGKLDNLLATEGAWMSAERPDRRVRLWVQACEIGRVREAGGRSGARFVLDTVGCSPLGSSGYVTPWRVMRGGFNSEEVLDESGGMRVESDVVDEGLRMKDESLKQNLQDSPNLQNLGGAGLSLVSHGGTGVFVVIAGIEVAEKRGRHWVRLPWCCKARVVDVVDSLNQNLQNSQDFQDSSLELDGSAVDMVSDGIALEFKELRREFVKFFLRSGFAIGGWDGGFKIWNPYVWIGLGP